MNEEKVKVYIDGNKEDLTILENGDVKVIKTVDVPFILGAYDVKLQVRKEIVKNSFNGYMKSLVFCIGILKEAEIKEYTFLASNGNLGSWLMMDSGGYDMVDVYERRYFGNLKTSGDEDNDGDGLCNLEESRYGMNPCRWDKDGDCLDDGWEVVNDLDAMDGEGDNGGDGEPYRDGLVNLIEYKRGMNPMKGYEMDFNGKVGLNCIQYIEFKELLGGRSSLHGGFLICCVIPI